MPSFQHALLPYPVSEYGSKYAPLTHGFPRDSCGPFGAYGAAASQEVSSQFADPYDMYDPYKHGGLRSSAPAPSDFGNDMHNAPAPVGAPMLPPLQVDERYVSHQPASNFRIHNATQYTEQQVSEEKAVGGVSAKLDYDMEQMTDFVAEMTVGLIKPSMTTAPAFRKWVLQVLNATRLPSATILLSLSYLTIRVRGLRATGYFVAQDRTVYQLIIVALILGSKFLDDNTFQNKSWAEVSNIPVSELNKDERDWLAAFNHRLHYEADAPDGFNMWQEKWSSYKARAASASRAKQAIEAELRRQQALCNSFSTFSPQQHRFARSPLSIPTASGLAVPSEASYGALPYSAFNGWDSQPSATSSSPASVSHTGPNTPDFYAAQSGWGSYDPYTSRPAHYGFGPLQQLPTAVPTSGMPYATHNYNVGSTAMWNCHSSACQCSGCRIQANFMQPRYGPIVVG